MSEGARVRVVEPVKPFAQDSATFVADFHPPDYLIDGILQRGFCYSNTGATGTGKTALGLRIMAHAMLGRSLGSREVQRCRVLMLAAENPDDVRARWIALGEHMDFDPRQVDAHFAPGVFSIPESLPELRQLAHDQGGFGLVHVDTSAAYFQGEEENSNTQSGQHARDMRLLTTLEGRPCVIVNCHPTKNAGDDNLLPRGGGAFLAEVDGNLTCAKKDGAVELHWQGKFRGPDFEAIHFELLTVTSDILRDSRGRHVPTVIARPLSDSEQTARATSADVDLQRLLHVMADNPGASIASLAEFAGWSMVGGMPYKSKAQRLLGELKKSGLAAKELNVWTLTAKGVKAAKRGRS